MLDPVKVINLLLIIAVILTVGFGPRVSAQIGEVPILAETSTSLPTRADATTSPVQGVSVPQVVTTPMATPRPIPPTSTPAVTPTIKPLVTTTQTGSGVTLGVILSLVAFTSAIFGFILYKSKTKKNKSDDDPCGSVRDLLEQKKKELEEMIRNYPEEKLKSMAKDTIVSELKKNEDAKKVIEIAESLKAKHDKLKETIEMLQKRYDLCMLELPITDSIFKGTVVENSLRNKEALKDIRVTKKYQVEDWTLHDVMVDKDGIDKLGSYLADGPWYMHFWQEGKEDVIVVFKNKNFKIKYSDKDTWAEAIAYGKSIGIPEEQLDFTIK